MWVFLALPVSSLSSRGIDGPGDACCICRSSFCTRSDGSRTEPQLDFCSRSTHEAPSAAKELVISQSDAQRQPPISASCREIPASVAPETQGWSAAQVMMTRKRMQRPSLSLAVIFLITLISGVVASGPSTPLRRRGR